jgi:hypothetical protein
MFSRSRFALGLTLLLTLLTSVTVFAKGSYAFITIDGPDLKEPIRSTDLALTSDFFSFAEFYQNATDAPADPGVGYEITRYYVDGGREVAFDRLHYYPDTGYVYYDGFVNGSSEYDRKWYPAKPEVKAVFAAALTSTANPVAKSDPSVSQSQPVETSPLLDPTMSTTGDRRPLLVIGSASLIVIALLVYFRRRSLAHS